MKIISTGSFLPPDVLTNAAIAEKTGLSPQWILTRTGIQERRIISANMSTSSLATEAAQEAIESAQIKPEEVAFVLVATSSPDHITPSVATSVQADLGLCSAFAFDISAGCSGFLYALKVAQALLSNESYRYGLVIGAETLSRHIKWDDHKTCALFGDGAGAAVIRKNESNENRIFDIELFSDGIDQDFLQIGSDNCWNDNDFFIRMNGREVFKKAVGRICEATTHVTKKLKISPREIRHFLCHQANIRIIDSVRRKLGLENDIVPTNLNYFGNTGAASIPILLDQLHSKGSLKRGDLLFFAAFGAGFTWASGAINW